MEDYLPCHNSLFPVSSLSFRSFSSLLWRDSVQFRIVVFSQVTELKWNATVHSIRNFHDNGAPLFLESLFIRASLPLCQSSIAALGLFRNNSDVTGIW